MSEARGLSTALGLSVPVLVGGSFELYDFVTESGRWSNPYLNPYQKRNQALIVVGGDFVFGAALLIFEVHPYIAIPAAVLWALGAEAVIYKNLFPGQYRENRKLEALD